MKKLLLILCFAIPVVCAGQKHPQRTFLFVHGAWVGGWDYAKVDSYSKDQR